VNLTVRQLTKPTFVALVANGTRLGPRPEHVPFLTLSDKLKNNVLLRDVVVPPLNNIASLTERAVRHRLYTLELGILPPNDHPTLKAVVDLINMKLLVKQEYLDLLTSEVQHLTDLLGKLAKLIPTELTVESLTKFMIKVPQVIIGSVWLCIACTVVLGIGFPLAWSYALYLLNEQICQYFKMDVGDCATQGVELIMLGNILILPAAYIIIKICGLSTASCKN
jgi:hypothetical protein